MLKQRDLIGCIFHMAQMLERMCDSNARMTGLTGSQARLLCFLSIVTLSEEVFQKDIEEVFGIRPSSATGLLQALEQQDFIRRVPVARDARLKKIVLTPKAEKIQVRVNQTHRQMQRHLQGPMSNEEVFAFMDTCDALAGRASSL